MDKMKEIQIALYHYHLGLVEREDRLFSLIDLNTGECYEKMTIYYIQRLLACWNMHSTVEIQT